MVLFKATATAAGHERFIIPVEQATEYLGVMESRVYVGYYRVTSDPCAQGMSGKNGPRAVSYFSQRTRECGINISGTIG